MHMRLLSSLRAGLSYRVPLRRLQQLFEPKDLEDMGLRPAELHILAGRGLRLRTAELYGLVTAPAPRRASPRRLH